MELRDSITLFIKRWKLSVAMIVLIVGGAFVWSYGQPEHFTTSISFAVNRINKEQTIEYQYDGFYALQASDLFAQTVVSWLQTPSVLVSIYDRAGIASDTASMRSLTSRFKTKKYSSQNIVVTYNASTEVEGKKLAQALSDELSGRTSTVNRSAKDQAQFEVLSSKPVIVLAHPNPLLIAAVSFIVALMLVLFVVPFVDYLSAVPNRP